MFKYVGTEEQLIELGFELSQHIGYCVRTRSNINIHYDCYIIISPQKNVRYNLCSIETSNDKISKLFCDMYKQNLIVWENENDEQTNY